MHEILHAKATFPLLWGKKCKGKKKFFMNAEEHKLKMWGDETQGSLNCIDSYKFKIFFRRKCWKWNDNSVISSIDTSFQMFQDSSPLQQGDFT